MDNIATLKGLRCPHCGGEQLTVTGTKGALGSAITGSAFGAIGNLVAGSNAAANLETEPMQYKCAGCGKKFQTFPLIAPTQDVLPAPCTVTFTRNSGFVGAVVPQIVYINGVKLGPVKNGKSITFTTLNRYNVIFVTDQYGMAFKSEFRFEAQPGGYVTVQFKRKFLNTPSIPAMVPYPAANIPAAIPSYPSASASVTENIAEPQVCFCTNCGGTLAAGSKFCQVCGEKAFSPQSGTY